MRLPRPSAPLVVSFLALFVSLGGVGYAAIHLPVHSVGNAQLQNFSVGNAKLRSNSVGAGKIIPGSIGATQVNSSQVQLRVAGPCTLGAMQSIGSSGSVTCTPTLPNEYGSNTAATALGANSTQVATQSLAAGSSYLVLAYPHAVISSGNRGTARRGRLHAVGARRVGHAAPGESDDHDQDLRGRCQLERALDRRGRSRWCCRWRRRRASRRRP